MHEFINCNSTKVLFSEGFGELSDYVKKLGKNILWVCDSNTAKMVRPLPEPNVVLDYGETSKTWDSVERILTTATENGFTRDCVFLALGGGVVSDVTAFAASIYMRGTRLVLIPTSLLGMADAAIGGKTGINYKNYKDYIGTYYSPESVIICTDCLRSLSETAFVSGLSEIIKHSFLCENEDLVKELVLNKKKILERDPEELRKIIEMSIKIKQEYVAKDPLERNGSRFALELGHTFAHALESIRRMQITHGQAVAWGVCKAAEVAAAENICTEHYAQSIKKLYENYGFNTEYRVNKGEWYEFKSFLARDSKVFNDKQRFVLPQGQGKTTFVYVNDKIVMNAVIQNVGI